MEDLYLKTEKGDAQIEPGVVRKYNLEKGLYSPFTHQRLVNQNGEFPAELKAEKDPKNTGGKDLGDEKEGGVMMSTSEIIDFAQGADSSTGH
jgi:hypothetical protein